MMAAGLGGSYGKNTANSPNRGVGIASWLGAASGAVANRIGALSNAVGSARTFTAGPGTSSLRMSGGNITTSNMIENRRQSSGAVGGGAGGGYSPTPWISSSMMGGSSSGPAIKPWTSPTMNQERTKSPIQYSQQKGPY